MTKANLIIAGVIALGLLVGVAARGYKDGAATAAPSA